MPAEVSRQHLPLQATATNKPAAKNMWSTIPFQVQLALQDPADDTLFICISL
jgi:hypothetical protein